MPQWKITCSLNIHCFFPSSTYSLHTPSIVFGFMAEAKSGAQTEFSFQHLSLSSFPPCRETEASWTRWAFLPEPGTCLFVLLRDERWFSADGEKRAEK